MLPQLAFMGISTAVNAILKNQERQRMKGFRPPSELSEADEADLRGTVSDIVGPQIRGAYGRERGDISRISAAADSRGMGRTGVPVSAIAERTGSTSAEISAIQGEGAKLFEQMYANKLGRKIKGYETRFVGDMERSAQLTEGIMGGMESIALMDMMNVMGGGKSGFSSLGDLFGKLGGGSGPTFNFLGPGDPGYTPMPTGEQSAPTWRHDWGSDQFDTWG